MSTRNFMMTTAECPPLECFQSEEANRGAHARYARHPAR